MTSYKYSFLDLVKICDTPSNHDEAGGMLVPFYLNPSSKGPMIGHLRPQVVEQLRLEVEWGAYLPWAVDKDANGLIICVSFQSRLSMSPLWTGVIKELCKRWRDTRVFDSSIRPKMWRNELYPVYHNPFAIHDQAINADEQGHTDLAFEMEQVTCPIFGLPLYGVYMNAYKEETMKIWVPMRAKTKKMCVYNHYYWLWNYPTQWYSAGQGTTIIPLPEGSLVASNFWKALSRNQGRKWV